jgi:hypothetical protein
LRPFDDLRAVDFLAVDLRPVDLRAVDLRPFDDRRAVDFLAVDFLAVDLRPVDFLAVDLRAVDLRAVDLRAVDLRAVDLRAAALRAVDLRAVDLRAAAAFFPAATRFVDFRAVDLLAVDFRAAALRGGADFRFRVAAAFLPAATRFVDFLAVDVLAVDVAARPRPGVRLLPVGPLSAGAAPIPVDGAAGVGLAASIGPPTPDVVVFERGTGRSHAGVSGRQDGSGASDASRLRSSASRLGSDPPVSRSVLSLPGHSRGSRSDDGMCALPPRVGVISLPYPNEQGTKRR